MHSQWDFIQNRKRVLYENAIENALQEDRQRVHRVIESGVKHHKPSHLC